MRKTLAIGATAVAGLVSTAAMLAPADAGDRRGGVGPDVVASRIGLEATSNGDDIFYYGTSGGVRAYSLASTSCNLGDVPADWIDQPNNARNPVIAQNLYRLSDDLTRIEQIGMSWVKHSFCAVNEDTCGDCQDTSCNTLGVGCADTYWATLNGQQGTGPGGVHDDIYDPPSGPGAIAGRLQVKDSDIIAGARYFAEIQYVTHDEAFDRRWNNASHREVVFDGATMSGWRPGQGSVRQGDPAIMEWPDNNPQVEMDVFEDDPGRGRFHLGTLVTDNGDGTWTYEYALHNLNSDRAANMFSVAVPDGVSVSATGFHDVDYHSGDGWNGDSNFDGTDWPASNTAGALTWQTDDFATNPNANALRWGTMYNFRFTADTPPTAGDITVGLYKPGGRKSVVVTAQVPGGPVNQCPADIAEDDSVVDVFDLLELLAGTCEAESHGPPDPGRPLFRPPCLGPMRPKTPSEPPTL